MNLQAALAIVYEAYSLPQSDTEWNLKSPTSANTPRCTPVMAAGAGLFDSGVFGPVQSASHPFERFSHQNAMLVETQIETPSPPATISARPRNLPRRPSKNRPTLRRIRTFRCASPTPTTPRKSDWRVFQLLSPFRGPVVSAMYSRRNSSPVLDSSRLIMNTITAAEGRADFWTPYAAAEEREKSRSEAFSMRPEGRTLGRSFVGSSHRGT